MANLNAWMITGPVKSMEEIKGGIECVSFDIECAPFERYDEEVFTFSFHFYGRIKKRSRLRLLLATQSWSPGR